MGGPAVSASTAVKPSVLRSDEDDPPVTVIREIRVQPGKEAEFEALMAELIAGATRQPGHLGATVVRPDPLRHGDAHRFIYKFDRRSRLEAWHRSEDRARLSAPIEALIVSDRFDAHPGLETWFELPGASTPPRWKTTLMTWSIIYVLVVIVLYALHALRFEAPIPLRALVLTGIVVPLVGFVFAPWMGRLLHGWLYKEFSNAKAKKVR
jgi:antibiotic biosynthesis monooxygenase (ABM) superfamily enzyme